MSSSILSSMASRKARSPLMNFESSARKFQPSVTTYGKPSFQPRNIPRLAVVQPGTLARNYVNLQEVAAWVLNGIQWFAVLEQPTMIAIWIKDWKEAAKFEYLNQILQVNLGDYIQLDEIDKLVLQWQTPTTMWTGHRVIGFMAETDFEDRAMVGLPDFNPTWSFPAHAVNSNYENITFGIDALHIKKENPNPKDALISQSLILVFKAATILQSLGVIARRILLPSSGMAGKKKDRTYCPTTWNYAYLYDTPAIYSDQLRGKGAASLLSHECVLSVIVQMSNKKANHPQCAFAHSPSCVLSGMMVSLTPVLKPQIARPIKLSELVEFDSIEQMRQVLNSSLAQAEDFVEVKKPRAECGILTFSKDDKNSKQFVICPEQDCESLVFYFDQAKSMIETFNLHETFEWKERVEKFHEWYNKIYKKKDKWTWETSNRKSWYKGSSNRSTSPPSIQPLIHLFNSSVSINVEV